MTKQEKLSEKLRKLSAEYESAGFSFFAITRAVNELQDGTDEAITHLVASGDDNQIALSLCETFIDFPAGKANIKQN